MSVTYISRSSNFVLYFVFYLSLRWRWAKHRAHQAAAIMVYLYKGSRGVWGALDMSNYRVKLTEQVMKLMERIVNGLIRQLVSMDDSQFGFVPGRGSTDVIVVRQLQEKYLAANKRLCMVFVDLEKAFDGVPWKVIWWALRKIGVEEWIVQLVQGMYANARSHVSVGEGYSKEFEGWCSRRLGTQPAALYHCAWSLVTWISLWGALRGPLCRWPYNHGWIVRWMCQEALDLERSDGRERAESKCRKDEDHDLCTGLDLMQSSGEFPCAICRTWMGSNSIFCNGCKHWMHKKCIGLKLLTEDPDYRCTRCQRTASPFDGRPRRVVQVGPDKLEVVASFCYLGDMLSAAGGCELSTTTCENCLEEELLPVLSSCHLSFKM